MGKRGVSRFGAVFYVYYMGTLFYEIPFVDPATANFSQKELQNVFYCDMIAIDSFTGILWRRTLIMQKGFFRKILLSLSLLIAMQFTASAYGASDQKLIITHINSGFCQGAGLILGGDRYKTLGESGSNYAWWKSLVFDWDKEQQCYILTGIDINSNNKDKSSVKIPSTGFAYLICVGNDYSKEGGINYLTQRMIDCNSYSLSLETGTKAYLYGTSLADNKIKNNGKFWYAPDFESGSYIKIGKPVPGEEAYNPEKQAQIQTQYVITPNHVNDDHYAMEDCCLFTPDYGSTCTSVYGDYSWWTSVVFSWDAAQDCYVCIAKDPSIGNDLSKRPPIPANGFTLMLCGSEARSIVSKCEIGGKAYLYKEDQNWKIALNAPIEGKTVVKPSNPNVQLPAPKIKGLAKNGKIHLKDNFTVSWEAVKGAESYTVYVLNSTFNALGKTVVSTRTVKNTSLTLDHSVLAAGKSGVMFLTANAAGKASSTMTAMPVISMYENELSSVYQDKTVVAFGDSLIARTGCVGILESYLGTEVINAGVGGDTTKMGKDRFQKDVLDRNPDITLICFGMNDQAQGTSGTLIPLETYIENMKYFITTLKASGSSVILIAPHDVCTAEGYYKKPADGLDYAYKGNMAKYCDAIRSLASECGCGLIDINKVFKQAGNNSLYIYGDGIHLSPAGHVFWAKQIGTYMLEHPPVQS